MLKPYVASNPGKSASLNASRTTANKSNGMSLNASRKAKGLPVYNAADVSKAKTLYTAAYNMQKRALNASLLPTSIIPSATQPGDVLQKTVYMKVLQATLVDWLVPEIATFQTLDSRHGAVPYTVFSFGEDKGTVKAGQTFASPFELSRGTEGYSSNFVQNEPLTKSVLRAPVLPTTVRLVTTTATIADDGKGNLVDVTDPDTPIGTIDYATGRLGGVTVDPTTLCNYRVDNISAAANTPPIFSKVEWLDLVAEDRTLAARWSMAAAYDMEKQYGLDGPKLLEEQATSQIVNELNTEVALDMFYNAAAGQPIVWSAEPPLGQGQAGDLAHDNSFIRAINAGSQRIWDATGRIRPNIILCGSSVMTVIQGMTNFKPAGAAKQIGSYYAGTLGDHKVYCFRGLPHDQYVQGFKSNNEVEPAYVFAPYMLVTATAALMDATFTGQQGFASSYAKKMVNPRAFIRGVITNCTY